jgi:hypothetical protein
MTLGLTLQARVVRNLRKRGVTVLTRRQWGSRYASVYRYRLAFKRVKAKKADTLVQHITVTFDSGKLIGDFKEDMRTIERIGYERFKSGFSYNFGVDMANGTIGVGMPLLAKGTHTINDKGVPGYSYDQNLVARAVAVVGMPGTPLSDKAQESITQLIAALMDEGAITLDPDYKPHSFFAYKDCPCEPTRRVMPQMLERAKKVRKKVGR